ncbi:Conserved subname: full [Haemophilus haemolyticus M21127]|uniref:hypothetical protein n=1 Tax=Haemophilus haemolyticus TaxID=726 RepID=UPI00021B3F31|nr:hypothetical protein [Haemophilus haemolyticus]EGT77629.1 Conserved subname: full [Haemophilus haemolyticus M21127]
MKKHQLKNSFTYFMKSTEKALKIMTCLFGAIIVSAVISLGAKANQTDWRNNTLSEQIQAETQCELKGGVYENGACLPPNLTLAAEKELQAYTAQKQEEINRTWSK